MTPAAAGTPCSPSSHGILILLTHLLIFLSSNTITQSTNNVSEIDRQALLSFKHNIVEDPTGVLRSWSSLNFCNWRGVTCGITLPPRVVSLNLSSENLQGQVSPWIANLTSLEQVDLSDNSFVGVIPEELGRLQNLQFMILSDNKLSGSVPSSLGNASSLTEIWLEGNTLSGSIPETLSLIQNLSVLSLASNDLSGHVSAKLCNISSLLYLDLARNNLTGRIPSSIGNTLPNLKWLSMSVNRFGGLIPSSLANASKLQQIDLGYNSLVGPVPSLGSLADLQLLNLQFNFLEAEGWKFIVSLANCAQLQILDMSGNALNGSFPRSVGNLSTSLQRLNLGRNLIIGTIPAEIFNLHNLQLLAMDQNLLTGVIPPVIGNLGQLFILTLSGNSFSGQIPPTIGNLSRLNKLYLDSNGLSGIIPASLGYCKQLDMLNLSFNSLQGQIPSELVNSTTLLHLDLSNNNLTGSIPLQIGALLQLLRLDISFNNLSGQVPVSLGRCVQLSSLTLRSNMLNGSIPLSFTDLKSIGEIDLSENYLGGQIPQFLANMGYLQKLNLSNNFFEGPIPTGGIFQNYSAVILDGNTGLCETAAAIFGLPICPTKSTTKRKMNERLLLIITPPVTIAFLSFLCVVVTIMKGTKAQPSENFKETMKRVSYGNIIKATNWFSLVNRISSSHTASVYIGRFEFETDLVAIKVFHLNEQGSKNSFFTECEVLKHTRHRNLVQAITLCSTVDFDDNEFKAIVYEFMANGSLDMWIHPRLHRGSPRRLLSLGQRISIAADVASALDYLHNQLTPPMIHCDLKPSNVLLDYDMTSRIGDFGSAKFLSSSLGTPEGLAGVGGTIGYIAPEYGMGCKISTGGDVYSFGVLLLEMLTAVRPTDTQCGNAFSLHKYVDLAFPTRIAEVLDPHMPSEEDEVACSLRMQNYVVPLVSIGLMCTMESPKDRPGMHDVCAKIVAIKEAFVETL